jgi:hypothetical protein
MGIAFSGMHRRRGVDHSRSVMTTFNFARIARSVVIISRRVAAA